MANILRQLRNERNAAVAARAAENTRITKVLDVACYNNFEKAPLLYQAAWSVFKSLPPIELLTQFDRATYDAWYASRFTDSSDGWSSGPALYKDTGNSFVLETPTSSRIIKVQVVEGKIWNCEILFPSGSIQAAGDILLQAKQVEAEMPSYPVNSTFIADGEVCNGQIREMTIEDSPLLNDTWVLLDRTICIPRKHMHLHRP